MAKIRLTERQLKKIIKEAVENVFGEMNKSIRVKLSELTYDMLQELGLPNVSMPCAATDALRSIGSEMSLERAKKELGEKYGDVDLIINPNAEWFDVIKIDNPKFNEDLNRFENDKGDWCRKYGSN